FDLVGENLEAGTCEMPGNRLNFNRVTQVRLVRTIFADSRVIGNARPFLGDALAFGKLLEHRGDDGLDRIPDVFLGDEAHLEVELVEFARQAVSAEIGRASCREGGWIEGVGGAAGERRAVDECGDTEIIGRVVDGVYPGRAAYRAWA